MNSKIDKQLKDIEFEYSEQVMFEGKLMSGKEVMERFENPDDEYNSTIIRYAIRWAKLMQQGSKGHIDMDYIIAYADKYSHKADIEGITGFMYGYAIHILSLTWKHGELLRKWHNKDYQGEGTVNPAILVI